MCLSYKGGCGLYEHACVKAFKSIAYIGYSWVISIILLFRNSYTTRELNIKAILSLKQYWISCYVVLSNLICDWI